MIEPSHWKAEAFCYIGRRTTLNIIKTTNEVLS